MTSIVSTDHSIIILALSYWYLGISVWVDRGLCSSVGTIGPPKIQEPIGKIQEPTNIENKQNLIKKKVTLEICLAPSAVESSNICGSHHQIDQYG